MCKTQKHCLRFSKTQLFSKKKKKNIFENVKSQKFDGRISIFFLNYSGICQVFAVFAFSDTQMSLLASKFKSNWTNRADFCALGQVFKTQLGKFCQNLVVFQKISSEITHKKNSCLCCFTIDATSILWNSNKKIIKKDNVV